MREKPQLWEARVALPENFSKTPVPTIGMRYEGVSSAAAKSRAGSRGTIFAAVGFCSCEQRTHDRKDLSWLPACATWFYGHAFKSGFGLAAIGGRFQGELSSKH